MIVFDMNNRERARFAEQLATLQTALGEAIKALIEEDDQHFADAMVTFALIGPGILEGMKPVFDAAQQVDFSDLDGPIPGTEEE